MRIAYKAFEPGFICRGVRFRGVGQKNVTEAANCAKNGWHCAENPADCLSYYPDIHRAVYCLVAVNGDTDEDATDSKISCTELTILRQLSLPDYFLHILVWMAKHPCERICRMRAGVAAARNGYAIVRGKNPCAKGAAGDILAMAKEDADGEIEQIAVHVVDGVRIPENQYVDIDEKELEI